MKKLIKLLGLILAVIVVSTTCLTGCKKPVVPPPPPPPPPTDQVIMTTTIEKGSKIFFIIDAAIADQKDVWIDFNDNKIKDKGEEVIKFGEGEGNIEYKVDAQNITIHGKITFLKTISNSLTKLDASNITLKYLNCERNAFVSFDVSNATALSELFCDNSKLKTLDLSKNVALTNLRCGYNEINTLNLSKNVVLKRLFCVQNQISVLKVAPNSTLTLIECYLNQIDGDNMTTFINSLPTCKEETKGNLTLIKKGDINEKNKFAQKDSDIAKAKFWAVTDDKGNAL